MSDSPDIKKELEVLLSNLPTDPEYENLKTLIQKAIDQTCRLAKPEERYMIDREIQDIKEINKRFLDVRKRKALEMDYKEILSGMLKEQFQELNKMNGVVADEIEKLRTEKIKLEVELQEEKKRILDARTEMDRVMAIRKEKVIPIEGKLNGLKDSIFQRELKYRIILQLLRDGYLKDPTYDIITTMKRHPEITTVERLAQVSNVNPNSIRQIFRSLQNRRILSWDMNNEKFHLVVETEV